MVSASGIWGLGQCSKQKIDLADAKFFEAGLDRALQVAVSHALGLDFGGDEYGLARHAGGGETFTYGFFVGIALGGVDVGVAERERRLHYLGADLAAKFPSAEPKFRDARAGLVDGRDFEHGRRHSDLHGKFFGRPKGRYRIYIVRQIRYFYCQINVIMY